MGRTRRRVGGGGGGVGGGAGGVGQKLFHPGTVAKSPVSGISQNNSAGARRAVGEMDGEGSRGRATAVPKKRPPGRRRRRQGYEHNVTNVPLCSPSARRPPSTVPTFTLPTAAEACSPTCPHPANHRLNKSNKHLGGPPRMYPPCVHVWAVTMSGYCLFQSKCLVCLERRKKVRDTFPCRGGNCANAT